VIWIEVVCLAFIPWLKHEIRSTAKTVPGLSALV
jgi:hypothetical protein